MLTWILSLCLRQDQFIGGEKKIFFLNISTLQNEITALFQNVRNWLRSDVMCPRRTESPEWLYFLRFLSSYYEFMSCGFYVVLAGKYLPMFWRIIVHTSSGSSNLKRIFIPKCSGLDIHLGMHESEEEGAMMFWNASSWHCVTPTRLYCDCNFFNSCCCVPGI